MPCISANVRGIVMHDTTSRAVKQESKRKRGFCVKVPLVIISALWGNKHGEETRSDRARGDRPRLLFGSYGKLARRTRVSSFTKYASINDQFKMSFNCEGSEGSWLKNRLFALLNWKVGDWRLASFDRFSFIFFLFFIFIFSIVCGATILIGYIFQCHWKKEKMVFMKIRYN